MSIDLSTFPPNSSHVGNPQDDPDALAMCYGPKHLDLTASKESVADWAGSGKILFQGDVVNVVTFKDGTSTVLCTDCGIASVGFGLQVEELEPEDRVSGMVTREDMETASIYKDYKKTFGETVSVQMGTITPEGDFSSFFRGNPEFVVDKKTMTDSVTVLNDYEEFLDSQEYDMSTVEKAREWAEEWDDDSPSEKGDRDKAPTS
ncbi:hypothetical protein L198_06997 [Cryptococcus wingfieldii CBS 7118]|uniref:Uncharacterized protein n=1 Tax=Cryptococcus wingfieldii CBS 7118 TaxID=1295528 RepID=A0A1E3IFJ8_9TREE|nr:hypothetical protein L198_06997 [Cryptococcus wingfieldii CBS 7118]ODN87373.1 hypothetical protein L198_06997 [Cryptococcus wingfieldii CBS 7118]